MNKDHRSPAEKEMDDQNEPAGITAEEHPTPRIKHQGHACGSANYISAGIFQVGQK